MTRERLELIRCEHEQAMGWNLSATFDAPLLLWGETIKALEEVQEEADRLRKHAGTISLMVHPDSVRQYVTFSIQHDGNKLTIGLDSMGELRP